MELKDILAAESSLKKKVKADLKKSGYVIFSPIGKRSSWPAGYPDCHVIGHGRSFWIEFKREYSGTLQKNQEKTIQLMRENGIEVWVIYSYEDYLDKK